MAPLPGPHLVGIVRIDFVLETLTGLLIRMPVQAQTARIGGADAYPMVTRKLYVIDGNVKELEVPYIPGSSLKGRMRSLLEQSLGKKLYTTDFKIWMHVRNLHEKAMSLDEFENDVKERCEIDDLFGYMSIHYDTIYKKYKEKLGKEKDEEAHKKARELFELLAPTRLLVNDLFPSQEYVAKLFRDKGGIVSIADFLEEKSENRIDRVTSAADPRDIVRVKPHVEFDGRITLLVFDRDLSPESQPPLKKYVETVFKGLKLVEETYLGSSGSRGYGRVKFKNIKIKLMKTSVSASEMKYEDIDSATTLDEMLTRLNEVVKKIIEKLSK